MTVKVFISYSHDEYMYMDMVRKNLQAADNGKIEIQTDEQIIPGQEWDKQIRNGLRQANIILFLVSKKFILSRYIKEVELQNAIERYDHDQVVLIPVLLEKLDEEDRKAFPLNKFEPLPVENKKEKPVKDWDQQKDAFDNIVNGIQRAVDNLLMSKSYNTVIIKKFQDYYENNQPEIVFNELQKMKPFLKSLDPAIFNAYIQLAAEWKENKNNMTRRTRNATDEKRDILNRLLDFITDLETNVKQN